MVLAIWLRLFREASAVFGIVPQFLAKAPIKVLGNFLIEALKDQLTTAQRKVVQKIGDDTDAKAMLEWSLKFPQALER